MEVFVIVFDYLEEHRNILATEDMAMAEDICDKLNIEYEHQVARYKIEKLIVLI